MNVASVFILVFFHIWALWYLCIGSTFTDSPQGSFLKTNDAAPAPHQEVKEPRTLKISCKVPLFSPEPYTAVIALKIKGLKTGCYGQ